MCILHAISDKNSFLQFSEKLCVIDQKLKLYKLQSSTSHHLGILWKHIKVRNINFFHLCSFFLLFICNHFWIAEIAMRSAASPTLYDRGTRIPIDSNAFRNCVQQKFHVVQLN